MTEGLIGSYAGRMGLCIFFAFLGIGSSVALTFVTHLRKGLPLTTQTNRHTGVKEHGFGRWFLTFAAFLAGPWLLLAVGMAGTHYVLMLWSWTTGHWFILPIAAVLLLTVGATLFLARRAAADDRRVCAQMAALPAHVPAPAVVAEPVVGWSLPADAPQWSER